MFGSAGFRTGIAAILATISGTASAADEKELASVVTGQWVFVGKVTNAQAGPVGLSDPPLFTFTLSFDATENLRGKKPDVKAFRYSIRQKNAPVFPPDQPFLVAVKKSDGGWVVSHISPADKDSIAIAKSLLALPVGWTITDGKPVSPWASLKTYAWPEGAPKPTGPSCAKSGRPALFAGDAVAMTVEQVIPEKVQEFRNPFGNGQFKVTVKNTSDKPIEVPALLTDGKTIFWSDSMLVMYQNQPLMLGDAGRAKAAKPVQLKAGESVSGIINTLTIIDGVEWPRGGSRVYFDFALGEKTASNFFYYFSQLHDPIRDAAIKKLADK